MLEHEVQVVRQRRVISALADLVLLMKEMWTKPYRRNLGSKIAARLFKCVRPYGFEKEALGPADAPVGYDWLRLELD